MKDPEILSPGSGSLTLSSSRTWKQVRYNIAVLIGAGQSTHLGTDGIGLAPNVRAQQVFGRALGERSDGSCFYSSVDLPWIWEDEEYDWRPIALERLNTFLDPQCGCESRNEEVVYCRIHKVLCVEWASVDGETLRRTRAIMLQEPYAGYGNGPLPFTTVMHRDYPWVRLNHRLNQWMCFMCMAEMSAAENPSWRNVFINRHSHCGFHNPPIPKVVDLDRLAVSLNVPLCIHCEKPTYVRNSIVFHQNGYRSCHWSHVTYAQVEKASVA